MFLSLFVLLASMASSCNASDTVERDFKVSVGRYSGDAFDIQNTVRLRARLNTTMQVLQNYFHEKHGKGQLMVLDGKALHENCDSYVVVSHEESENKRKLGMTDITDEKAKAAYKPIPNLLATLREVEKKADDDFKITKFYKKNADIITNIKISDGTFRYVLDAKQ